MHPPRWGGGPTRRRLLFPLLGLVAASLTAPAGGQSRPYPWAHAGGAALSERLSPSPGAARLPQETGSFGAWLRGLPTLPEGSRVRLHDGGLKARQDVHLAVIDLDVGPRDLQQCADAVMRLRAEWLWASGRADEACFRFTSGDAVSWRRWRAGERPRVRGNKVSWTRGASTQADHSAYRRWLDQIFVYAGTASLVRGLRPVPIAEVAPGDVLIQGGHPGHAMIVVDVQVDKAGRRSFALAQSYMPAQQLHLVKGPGGGAWYPAQPGPILTPEWRFDASDLRRFPEATCAKGAGGPTP